MPLSHLSLGQPTWTPPDPIPEDVDLLALHPHRLIASLLWRRGITTPDEASAFMDARSPETLDPYRLPNMAAAVQRVTAALQGNEHIGIFGDYDADGVTSAALLYRALASVIGEDRVTAFVPDRSDGYGVSERGVRHLAAHGATLMIAADCGSNDHAAVQLARDLGMDVVILDHHQIADTGPNGAITVNPQLHPDLLYGELTGVGVSYLLVRALAAAGFRIARLDNDDERQMLDLVALGTVSDVGSLRGANRILVREGLHVLRNTQRAGLRAMFRHGEFDPQKLTADRISFGLGPRLNAAGRIESPTAALDLLLTDDDSTANDLAMKLERHNTARRLRTSQMLKEAADLIRAMPDWETRPLIVIHHADWETGLVGPIASKVVEQMGRPALVMREEDGVLSGSGRSVPGVDLVALLNEAEHLMTRFGGHAGAAGVTLPLENLERFNQTLAEAVTRQGLKLPQPPTIKLDAWLPEIAQRLDVARALACLEPFGHDNKVPMFGINDARLLEYSVMGKERNHLKLLIGTGQREMEAILWRGAARSSELVGVRRVHLAGRLSINAFRGNERLQLTLEDFRRVD
jgi:single-stranded-DNA-specific exonuclease